MRKPSRRADEPDDVWSTFTCPQPSAEGYRIVWVHSTALSATNAETRRRRVSKACAGLDELAVKLAGPKSRLASRVAVETAAAAVLDQHHATRFVTIHIEQIVEESFKQDGAGRPGPATRYKRTTRPRFRLTYRVRDDVVLADAASDGCFPIVSNDTTLTDAQLLAAYKYQPQPRTPTPPAQRRPARRPGVPQDPRPHRGPPRLPLPGPADPSPARTRDPQRHA
jgi:hypothetical protein